MILPLRQGRYRNPLSNRLRLSAGYFPDSTARRPMSSRRFSLSPRPRAVLHRAFLFSIQPASRARFPETPRLERLALARPNRPVPLKSDRVSPRRQPSRTLAPLSRFSQMPDPHLQPASLSLSRSPLELNRLA